MIRSKDFERKFRRFGVAIEKGNHNKLKKIVDGKLIIFIVPTVGGRYDQGRVREESPQALQANAG